MIDQRERKLKFRDITGEDLEYLESIFSSSDEKQATSLNLDQVKEIVNKLSSEGLDCGVFTQSVIFEIFVCLKDHILCNYMPKTTWLKICYGIQNGSFAGVADMEKVPMTKFVVMSQIHKEAIDSMDK